MRDLAALIIAAQNGDEDAFAALTDRFQGMAVGLVKRRLADADLALDVVQEAWLDAYLSLPTLRAPAAFSAWFRRILVKHVDRHLRGRQVTLAPLDAAATQPSSQPDGLEMLLRREQHERLVTLLRSLPDHLREVVHRCYVAEQPQQVIADQLDIPLTTVKKRLYLARQWLGVYLAAPTLDPALALPHALGKWTVPFWLALWAGDVDGMRELLRLDPTLVQQRECAVPLLTRRLWLELIPGYTPLHRAVLHDDHALVAILLAAQADANARTPTGITPLHLAVRNGAVASARMLLAHGAAVDARTTVGMTPLHWAALRRSPRFVALLGQAGASPTVADQRGQTPRHWEEQASTRVASSRWRRPLPLDAVLGRVVGPDGAPLDGYGPFAFAPPLIHDDAPTASHHLLATGIKAIDLFAPLRRGGIIGVRAGAGVGKLVLLCEMIQRLAACHHGCAVVISFAEHAVASHRFVREVCANGLTAAVTFVLCPRMASPAEQARCLAYGRELALGLAAEREVLLVIEEGLMRATNARHTLKSGSASRMTTLLFSADAPLNTPSAAPALDGQIVLAPSLARQGIYPAIDPLASFSSLVDEHAVSPLHGALVPAIRQLFARRHLRHDLARGQRLRWFQSQPFFLAEPYTARAGQTVDLTTTLHDYAHILAGNLDDAPLETVRFAGALGRA